jgi:ADP-ribosylglycohydrolase
MKADLHDRFRGCLIGGGLGDALGYPVEFMSLSEMKAQYGSLGIQELALDSRSGKALISDDTQMTLFTASGLLWAKHRMKNRGIGGYIESGIYPSYMRWLYTQDNVSRRPAFLKEQAFERDGAPKIMDVKELRACRAPGNTCLSALESEHRGEMELPINDSKGCGGVMRVAPIGLLLHRTPLHACGTAAKAAAITHGHPSGYLSAGALASIIAQLVSGKTLLDAYTGSCEHLQLFTGHEEASACLALAAELAHSDMDSEKAIARIGQGWVGEEALAIALYCALKEKDPLTALIMSVNHDGDSDSTGAICGNLLGALHGTSAFPKDWIESLEISTFIIEMADALYQNT